MDRNRPDRPRGNLEDHSHLAEPLKPQQQLLVSGAVRELHFSPSGEQILVRLGPRLIEVWSSASSRCVARYELPHDVGAIAPTPDDTAFFAAGGDAEALLSRIEFASQARETWVVDRPARPGDRLALVGLSPAPDGSWVALDGHRCYETSDYEWVQDPCVHRYDLATGHIRWSAGRRLLKGPTAFDDTTLLTVDIAHLARLDLENGYTQATYDQVQYWWSPRLLPDRQRLVTGRRPGLAVLDLATREVLSELSDSQAVFLKAVGGHYAATTLFHAFDRLALWDLAAERLCGEVALDFGACAFSPDGRALWCGTTSGALLVFDTAS